MRFCYAVVYSILQNRYDARWIIALKLINNNMNFEHEITFNDDSIQYLTSTTNYLNDDDKNFLIELDVDLTTIKTITTYKL